jgi:hypothetical protein
VHSCINLPAREERLRRIDHRLRRWKIRLADFHMNHIAPTRLKRTRVRGDFHHVKRSDVLKAVSERIHGPKSRESIRDSMLAPRYQWKQSSTMGFDVDGLRVAHTRNAKSLAVDTAA